MSDQPRRPSEELLRSARGDHDPSGADRERVRRALARRIADSAETLPEAPARRASSPMRGLLHPLAKSGIGVVVVAAGITTWLRVNDQPRSIAAAPPAAIQQIESRRPPAPAERDLGDAESAAVSGKPAQQTKAALPEPNGAAAKKLVAHDRARPDADGLSAAEQPARASNRRQGSVSQKLARGQVSAALAPKSSRKSPVNQRIPNGEASDAFPPNASSGSAADQTMEHGQVNDVPAGILSVESARSETAEPGQASKARAPSASPGPASKAERGQVNEPRARAGAQQVERDLPSQRSSIDERRAEHAANGRDELAFVKRIRARLMAAEHEQVLEMCAEHERRWPHGILVQEREALRAIATCGTPSFEAAGNARAFFASYPHSPMSSQVHAACAPQLKATWLRK